jgi:hypothetical protein
VSATLALSLHWPLEFPLPHALQLFHDLALPKSMGTAVLFIDGGALDELYCLSGLFGGGRLL